MRPVHPRGRLGLVALFIYALSAVAPASAAEPPERPRIGLVLAGGGYASDQSAVEIGTFINGIDWEAVVGGKGRRPLEPFEQKRLSTEANKTPWRPT